MAPFPYEADMTLLIATVRANNICVYRRYATYIYVLSSGPVAGHRPLAARCSLRGNEDSRSRSARPVCTNVERVHKDSINVWSRRSPRLFQTRTRSDAPCRAIRRRSSALLPQRTRTRCQRVSGECAHAEERSHRGDSTAARWQSERADDRLRGPSRLGGIDTHWLWGSIAGVVALAGFLCSFTGSALVKNR